MYSREPTKCRKCGKIIQFITTKKGKQMPVDSFSLHVLPREGGSIFFLPDGNTIRGQELDRKGPNTVEAYRSHFVTCPYADQLRKPKPDKEDERTRKIRERIEREREEAAERAAKREARAREEAERQAAQDAQLSLFRKV